MKLRIISLLVISVFSTTTQAASEQIVWGKSDYYLAPKSSPGFITFNSKLQKEYQLKKLDGEAFNANHIRYQLYFKQIPIWGHELILHKTDTLKSMMTGINVTNVEKDVTDTNGKFSALEIEHSVTSMITDTIKFKNIEKVIYLDEKKRAHLAYHFVSYTNNEISFMAAPNFIIDANSGDVLKSWDDLPHQQIGQGLGGNVFILPYRSGLFQHGNSQKDLPSLGKFDVSIKKGRCYVETPQVRVINVQDTNLDKDSFPVLSIVEVFKYLPTFSYPCDEKSNYVNINDGDTAPANFSFSSVNDTMYFAGITLQMYKEYYGLQNPIGEDLPLRAYTHIKHLDNAFAVPTIKFKGLHIIHQQIVIGDGDTKITAPAQGTLAHELSHNVTKLYSNLIYEGQSGGINESFSDMASIAMQDYLRKDYPWYWDGVDYTIGSEATLGAKPIRYMDHPEKDGHSINNAKDFTDKLDVHETSGVFNRAFYLLAHKPHWSVRKAFQVMLDANINYWTSGTHYEAAACGVIQAAKDRHYKKTGVIEAFAEVGVICPIKI